MRYDIEKENEMKPSDTYKNIRNGSVKPTDVEIELSLKKYLRKIGYKIIRFQNFLGPGFLMNTKILYVKDSIGTYSPDDYWIKAVDIRSIEEIRFEDIEKEYYVVELGVQKDIASISYGKEYAYNIYELGNSEKYYLIRRMLIDGNFKITGFRPPREGELYISCINDVIKPATISFSPYPRLIVEPGKQKFLWE